jgi:hypothetical protein
VTATAPTKSQSNSPSNRILTILVATVVALASVSAYALLRPPAGPAESYTTVFTGNIASNDSNLSNGRPCSVVQRCYTEATSNFSIPLRSSNPLLLYAPVTVRVAISVVTGPMDCTPAVDSACRYVLMLDCPLLTMPPTDLVTANSEVTLPNDNGTYYLPCVTQMSSLSVRLSVGPNGSTVEAFVANCTIAVMNDTEPDPGRPRSQSPDATGRAAQARPRPVDPRPARQAQVSVHAPRGADPAAPTSPSRRPRPDPPIP